MWKLLRQVDARRAATMAAAMGLVCAAMCGQPAFAGKVVVARAAGAASAASAPAYKPSPYAAVARQHAQAASATPLTNSMQNLRHQHRPAGPGHQ
jgi:hypothetical protein